MSVVSYRSNHSAVPNKYEMQPAMTSTSTQQQDGAQQPPLDQPLLSQKSIEAEQDMHRLAQQRRSPKSRRRDDDGGNKRRNNDHRSRHTDRDTTDRDTDRATSDRDGEGYSRVPSAGRSSNKERTYAAAAALVSDDDRTDTMTAVTSEMGYSTYTPSQSGYSVDDVGASRHNKNADHGIGFQCARYFGMIVAGVLIIAAVLSPVVMVVLPRVGLFDVKLDCGPECEVLLISLAVKILILLVGTWALFLRRPTATMPRIELYRAVVLLLTFLLVVTYWLFYGVRIVGGGGGGQESTYPGLVSFALSLVDSLLFIHYLAVILFHIRHVQVQYAVKVIRSPDGVIKHYTVGQYSIQSLAVWCLQHYYADFPVYNPYLSFRSRPRSSLPPRFKVYSVDGASDADGDTTRQCGAQPSSGVEGGDAGAVSGTDTKSARHDAALSDAGSVRSRGTMSSAGGRLMSTSHNQRFYEDEEHERRVKKRCARLTVAAEEAFGHVRQMQQDRGPNSPIDPHEAAQAIFPSLSRPLQKYLRITRQQPQHNVQSVIDDLAVCIGRGMSAKAFLSRYTTGQSPAWSLNDPAAPQTWTIFSDRLLTRSVSDGTVFKLGQGAVSLFVEVRRLPHYNLTEDVWDGKDAKFVVNRESITQV